MKNSPLRDRSFELAVSIVHLCRRISREKSEYVITRQLLKSGTNPGAMTREAQNAESIKDFIHKLRIALKEAEETQYWLDLLLETDLMSRREHEKIYGLCNEVTKMLTSSIITAQKRL